MKMKSYLILVIFVICCINKSHSFFIQWSRERQRDYPNVESNHAGPVLYDPRAPREVMVDVINNMGLRLLEVHNEHNENNIALSPYGAASVLVALLEGLVGDAALEIRDAIELPKDLSVVRVGLRDIHRHLKSYFIPKEGFLAGLTLSHDNITLNREFERTLRFYGYDIESFNNPAYPDSLTTPGSGPAVVTTVKNPTTSESISTIIDKLTTSLLNPSSVNSENMPTGAIPSTSAAMSSIGTMAPSTATMVDIQTTATKVVTTATEAVTTATDALTTATDALTTEIPKNPIETTAIPETMATTTKIPETTTLAAKDEDSEIGQETKTEEVPTTILVTDIPTTTGKFQSDPETTEVLMGREEPIDIVTLATTISTDQKSTTLADIETTNVQSETTKVPSESTKTTSETTMMSSNEESNTEDINVKEIENEESNTEDIQGKDIENEEAESADTNDEDATENKEADETTTTSEYSEIITTNLVNSKVILEKTQSIVIDPELEMKETTTFATTLSITSKSLDEDVVTTIMKTKNFEDLLTKISEDFTETNSEDFVTTDPEMFANSEDLATTNPADLTTNSEDFATTNSEDSATTNSVDLVTTNSEDFTTTNSEDFTTLSQNTIDFSKDIEKLAKLEDTTTATELDTTSTDTTTDFMPYLETQSTQASSLEDLVLMNKENATGMLRISANLMANKEPIKTRKRRTVIDYLLARYYDNYYVDGNSNRKHPYETETHYSNYYLPDEPYTFLVNGKFREPNVSFMTYDTVLPFYYMQDINAMALSFPLDSNMYYLLLVLPLDASGIDKLIYDVKRTTTLRGIVENLQPTHVKAVIPSFMLKGYVVLTPSLQKLCIRRIFEPRHADFSQMTSERDIYVTNIEQAVTVNIKNYMETPSHSARNLRQPPMEFRADRPFLYFVMDSQIHINLMAGKVVNPLNSRIR